MLEINTAETSITPVDYLRYFYYASLLSIGMPQYSEALDHLSQAIVTPALAVSAIVVQAIKKAKLLSLFHIGSSFQLPK